MPNIATWTATPLASSSHAWLVAYYRDFHQGHGKVRVFYSTAQVDQFRLQDHEEMK
jgi:hypothetical protein